MLLEANKLYCGELLPVNQTDAWFYQKSNRYKSLYLETVDELERFFLQEKDALSRLELYTKAAAIYPFDNWQIKQIHCLLEMYRYEDALKIYQDTMELYAREIGSEAPQQLHECFEQLELLEEGHRENIKDPYGWKKLDRVFLGKKNSLRKMLFHEENRKGAYYCTYPSFVDYCHLIARTAGRNKVEAVLMFLTLSRSEKKTVRAQMDLPGEMEKLKTAIGSTLRMGDAYTRYGNRHFILMLANTKMNFCGTIFERIEKAYAQVGRGELWYYADMTQELGQEYQEKSLKS